MRIRTEWEELRIEIQDDSDQDIDLAAARQVADERLRERGEADRWTFTESYAKRYNRAIIMYMR